MDSLQTRTAELVFEEGRNLHSALSLAVAEARDDVEVTWLTSRLAILAFPDGSRLLLDGPIALESGLGTSIVDDKQRAREFLIRSGVSTPGGFIATEPGDVQAAVDRWSAGVVVKPPGGSQGRGITVGVRTESEASAAFRLASDRGNAAIVEEHIDIEHEYRCMATPTTCISVLKRILPHVIGDGTQTIDELIDEKNRARRMNPGLFRTPIPKDHVVDRVLARQGLTRSDVLGRDRRVLVRDIGGISGGGEPHECGDDVGDNVKQVAMDAVAAIPGLGWAGVDVIVERRTGRALVLEVNINAGYGAVTFPLEGRSRNVIAAIWDEWRAHASGDDPVSTYPRLHRAPRTAAQLYDDLWETDHVQPFGLLFVRQMLRNRLAEWSSALRLVRVSESGGAQRWFTADAVGADDLLGPRRAARNHTIVRRFLEAGGVPRPRGRLIRDEKALRAVMSSPRAQFIATPRSSRWSADRSKVIGSPEELDPSPSRQWHVQRRLPGRRLRLYSTQSGAFAVTDSSPNPVRITSEDLRLAVDSAVSAVRSIPGLRWTAVDVVFVTEAASPSRVLVEGLTVRPTVNANERVLAGDLRDMFDWIAGAESHRKPLVHSMRQWFRDRGRGHR